jgi:hypothetical protein
MTDSRIDEVLRMLDPPSGERPWYGGASPLGCLRGVDAGKASWRPAVERKTIWEIALHMAYWKYDVRRKLADLPEGSFGRSPSNWPGMPGVCDEKGWRKDRDLFRSEHRGLVEAVRGMDPMVLDRLASGSKRYRMMDLLFGVVMHDVHHVGQIQMMKRMAP